VGAPPLSLKGLSSSLGRCNLRGHLGCEVVNFLLNAFADHQHVSGFSESYDAATAGAEHHPLRIDERFSGAVSGEKGAVNRNRCRIGAAGHKGDHCRPQPARGVLQPAMKAERARGRDVQAAFPRLRCASLADANAVAKAWLAMAVMACVGATGRWQKLGASASCTLAEER